MISIQRNRGSRSQRGARRRPNKSAHFNKSRTPLVAQVSSNKLVILNEAGRFAPDRLRVNLIYNDPTTSRNHASSNAMNWNYRSSAFDPDSSLGSGAIPGFVELANLYNSYLVRSMSLDLEIANQSLDSIILGIWPSNALQNVNSLNAAAIQEYSSNPRSQRHLMPCSTAGDVLRTSMNTTGKQLFGRQFLTDVTFASSTSSNPSLMYGINIGCFDGLGNNLPYPVVLSATVLYEIEFYGIRQLQS